MNNPVANPASRVSIAVAFLVPGTVINNPIYSADGLLLLAEKTPLTRELIDELKGRRIDRIYYTQQTKSAAPGARPALTAGPVPAVIDKKVRALAEEIFNEISGSIRDNTFIQTTGIHLLVEMLFRNLQPCDILPPEFVSPKPVTHGFIDHALHTAVLSMYIAFRHGFENTLVKQIGIGAFLHDIGALKLPPGSQEREEFGSREEEGIWRKHPVLGFELIKLNGQLSGIVRKIVLLHHESMDGSGYPLGVSEKDVGYYPYIVGLASAFDCFVSERDFRPALPLREALLKLVSFSGTAFPPYLVQLFVKHVSRTPAASSGYSAGQFVILSSREIARVESGGSNPDRPDVTVVRTADGHDADPAFRIRLTQDPARSISRLLPDELQQQLALRYSGHA